MYRRAIVILTIFFLGLTVFDNLAVSGARPELLLIVTIFFGFHFGIIRGAETGLICGILKDLFSITPFGVNTFSFLCIGFLSGYLRNKLYKENFFVQFLLSNLAVYFATAIYFLYMHKSLDGEIGVYFWRITAYKGLYTGVIAPILFYILRRLFERKETEGIA